MASFSLGRAGIGIGTGIRTGIGVGVVLPVKGVGWGRVGSGGVREGAQCTVALIWVNTTALN